MKKFFLLAILVLSSLISCEEEHRTHSLPETAAETEIVSETQDDTTYYLSLTGSYYDTNGVLHEVYGVFDFEEGVFHPLHTVPATSSYPCGVCDLSNHTVYFSAAEETLLGERLVLLDNVYAYDTDTNITTQLTEDGYYMNRLIPIAEKLCFTGGRRSSAAVEFGFIDLRDNTVVYPEAYADVNIINVRDIALDLASDSVYTVWYSIREQNRLDAELREQGGTDAERTLAPCYIDKIDIESGTLTTLKTFHELHGERITVSDGGAKLLLYAPHASAPFSLMESDMITPFDAPITACFSLSPDGNSVYTIAETENETGGIPHTVLRQYDLLTHEVTELCQFDFYVNSMVLLPTE